MSLIVDLMAAAQGMPGTVVLLTSCCTGRLRDWPSGGVTPTGRDPVALCLWLAFRPFLVLTVTWGTCLSGWDIGQGP